MRMITNQNGLSAPSEKYSPRDTRLEALLRASMDSIFLLSENGTILELNEVAAIRLGKSVDELKGENFFSYTYPEVFENRKKFINDVISTGKPAQFEEIRKESRYEVKIYPVLESDEKLIAVYSKDLTETWWMEKRINEQEKILEDLYENAPVMYISVDLDGVILKTNKLMETTLKYSKNELIGRKLSSLFCEQDSGVFQELFETIKKSKVRYEKDFQLLTKDGNIIDVFSEISTETEEESSNYIRFVLHDVSDKKRLEDGLRASESRYRGLVENCPNPILVTVGNKIVYANSKSEELSRPIIPDQTIAVENASRVLDYYKDLILARSAADKNVHPDAPFAYRMTTVDNRVSDLLDYTSDITFNGVDAVQHMIIDVTEQKRYEESMKALLRHSLEMADAASLDEVARMTLDTIQRVLGFKLCNFGVVEGNKLRFIYKLGIEGLPELPLDGEGITVRAVVTGKTQLVQDVRKDSFFIYGWDMSDFTPLSELVVPIKLEGEVVAVINVESESLNTYSGNDQRFLETIAEQAASRLNQLNLAEKEREAQRKVGEEAEKTRQANRLAEMKTDFIRTATHEIKTPLTSIKGYTELIQNQFGKKMDPTLVRYFDTIIRNTDRLQRLTEDLLDVQRIESGRLTVVKQPMETRELLELLMAEMTPLLGRRHQKLIIEGDQPTIFADQTRIIQVLVNLIANASRFAPEEGLIRLNISKVNSEAVFAISDEGKGILPEDMVKLFKPFPNIHVEGVPSGTGLGLSICKGIVDIHGGRIWVTSEGKNKGSTFTFTIPSEKHDDE